MIGVDYTDTEREALGYIERHGVTYPNGMDKADRVSRAYGITGVPETFLIDKEGNLAAMPFDAEGTMQVRLVGGIGTTGSDADRAFRARIEELLRRTMIATRMASLSLGLGHHPIGFTMGDRTCLEPKPSRSRLG